MDESATGSVNFFPGGSSTAQAALSVSIDGVHLRPPSVDHGVVSFLWALGLGLFLWLGMLAVGVEDATALILAAVAAGAIFLYVRLYGGDEPR